MKFHIPLAVLNSMPNYSNFDFETQEKREITWYTKKRRVQSAHAKSKIMLESKRKRKERQFIFSSINFSFSISFGHEECWCFYSEITLTFFFLSFLDLLKVRRATERSFLRYFSAWLNYLLIKNRTDGEETRNEIINFLESIYWFSYSGRKSLWLIRKNLIHVRWVKKIY